METWPLVDGPDLPQEALSLALGLEARGFKMVNLGGILRVQQGRSPDPLTAADQEAIRPWKVHLLAFLDYAERFRENDSVKKDLTAGRKGT